MEHSEYKIGDYVYCYRDNKYDGVYIHKNGNYYEIKAMITFHTSNVLLSCEKNEFFRSYWISFNNANEKSNKNFYYYFLSKQEYRKLKLEKLNERILNGAI